MVMVGEGVSSKERVGEDVGVPLVTGVTVGVAVAHVDRVGGMVSVGVMVAPKLREGEVDTVKVGRVEGELEGVPVEVTVEVSLPPPARPPPAEALPLAKEAVGVMEEVRHGEAVGEPVPLAPPDDTVALGVCAALLEGFKLTVVTEEALGVGDPVPPPTPSPAAPAPAAPAPGAVMVTVEVGDWGPREKEVKGDMDPPPKDLLWLGEGVMELEGRGDMDALGEVEGSKEGEGRPLTDTLWDRVMVGVREDRGGVGVGDGFSLALFVEDKVGGAGVPVPPIAVPVTRRGVMDTEEVGERLL